MLQDLDWVPEPQELEHEDQLDQPPFTGQPWVLHDCDVEGLPPPQDASDTVVPSLRRHETLLVWVPPPQVAEHDPHEPVCHEYEQPE